MFQNPARGPVSLLLWLFLLPCLASLGAALAAESMSPFATLDTLNGSCQLINTINKADQCQYALSHCSDENIGSFSYIPIYYCADSPAKSSSFLLSTVLLLVTLFTTLGLTASDFLCPDLNTISKILHMNENVAGLTLLAFGNGSPDLFSTYSSMKVGAGSLAIGELIGAALFITSVVVGSMSIVHPFKVIKKVFLRDILYFLVSLIVVDYFILIGHGISLLDCVVLLCLYVVYVFMIITWQFIAGRIKAKRKRELKARNQFVDDIEYDSALRHSENQYHFDDNQHSNLSNYEGAEEGGGNNDYYDSSRTPNIGDLISNTSLSLSVNPFLSSDEELVGSLDNNTDIQSRKSAGTGDSKIVINNNSTLSTNGYSKYSDILFPGEVRINNSVLYNVHENDIDDPEDGEEDITTVNQYFVRPSLLNALELNQTIKNNQGMPNWLNENSSASQYDDHISMRTVQQNDGNFLGVTDTNDNRPISEPLQKAPKIAKNKVISKSAPSYYYGPTAQYSDTPEESAGRIWQAQDIEDNNETSNENDEEHIPPQVRKSKLKKLFMFFGSGSRTEGVVSTNIKNTFSSRLIAVFLPSLIDFKSKPVIDKGLTILILPLLFVLRCTVPVIEYAKLRQLSESLQDLKHIKLASEIIASDTISAVSFEHTDDRNNQQLQMAKAVEEYTPNETLNKERILAVVQSFTSIIVLSFLVGSDLPLFYPLYFPLSILTSLAFSSIVGKVTKPLHATVQHSPHYVILYIRQQYVIYVILSFVGFAMSIVWISIIAEEVVAVLKFYSLVFGLSDAILGFTVFAIGNSLGDFVANFTIAKMGFPRMALAACFGGPLLNVLTGIGISGLISITSLGSDNSFYKIESGPTLWVSSAGLILNLLFLIVTVPQNGWKMDKKVGYVNICFWIVTALVNVIIELL